MDFEAILAKAPTILRNYWLVLLLAGAGLIFFIYGLIALLGSISNASDKDFTNSEPVL